MLVIVGIKCYFREEIIKSSELLRKLMKNGWFIVSQRGSHIKLKHLEINEIIILPFHGSKEVSKGLENKVLKIARLK